jgi:hypothetical protein
VHESHVDTGAEGSNHSKPELDTLPDAPDSTDAHDAQSTAPDVEKMLSPADVSRDDLHHGETVVEGEEDTVIY